MMNKILLSSIELAFSHRKLPESVVRPNAPDTDIYQDALTFLGKEWNKVTCKDFEDYKDAVSGFSPSAFCYYLAAICTASVREDRPDLLVNSALVSMLDRSNKPSWWDTFFIERWCLLTKNECEAVRDWILWLSEADPLGFSDDELSRAFDTLSTLSSRAPESPEQHY